MFKTRFTIELINITPDIVMERARFERCEELAFVPIVGMFFEVSPNEPPTRVYAVLWNFEKREFEVETRLHGLRYDSSGFQSLKDKLREAGANVVDYDYRTHSDCGHSEWVPAGSDLETCKQCRKRKRRTPSEAREPMTREPMTQLGLRVTQDIHERLKQEAERRGVSLNQICAEAFENELNRNPKVFGRILECERSPEFGCTVGRIECPECQDEIGIGVQTPPYSANKCRCGYEWTLETEAIGTKRQ